MNGGGRQRVSHDEEDIVTRPPEVLHEGRACRLLEVRKRTKVPRDAHRNAQQQVSAVLRAAAAAAAADEVATRKDLANATHPTSNPTAMRRGTIRRRSGRIPSGGGSSCSIRISISTSHLIRAICGPFGVVRDLSVEISGAGLRRQLRSGQNSHHRAGDRGRFVDPPDEVSHEMVVHR